MNAVLYEAFAQPPTVQTIPDPQPPPNGVVIQVQATGLCRSDWHGWQGHDPDITLPHVPGHEFAGTITAVGPHVHRWQPGQHVTAPFVCGCGVCPQCISGNHQVCDHQSQPGFTHWGSFADFVAVDYADVNLIALPDSLDFVTAASLGCRFTTAFHAIVDQGRLAAGQWVAIHGCGGTGLSAIMIAHALGANIVAIDIAPDKLAAAQAVGATHTLNATTTPDIPTAVHDLTHGGVHLSVDALGSPQTCFNSIANLRKRGRHVQVGLMLGSQRHPAIPMDLVVAKELEIVGSHGIQAFRYEAVFAMIAAGKLQPGQLVRQTITMAQAAEYLPQMNQFAHTGITVMIPQMGR
jgi:alcohol dehydrogenase